MCAGTVFQNFGLYAVSSHAITCGQKTTYLHVHLLPMHRACLKVSQRVNVALLNTDTVTPVVDVDLRVDHVRAAVPDIRAVHLSHGVNSKSPC